MSVPPDAAGAVHVAPMGPGLVREAWELSATALGGHASQEAWELQRVDVDPLLSRVAWHDGRLVGAVFVRPVHAVSAHGAARAALVSGLSVVEPLRGQGVARALLSQAVRACEDAGTDAVIGWFEIEALPGAVGMRPRARYCTVDLAPRPRPRVHAPLDVRGFVPGALDESTARSLCGSRHWLVVPTRGADLAQHHDYVSGRPRELSRVTSAQFPGSDVLISWDRARGASCADVELVRGPGLQARVGLLAAVVDAFDVRSVRHVLEGDWAATGLEGRVSTVEAFVRCTDTGPWWLRDLSPQLEYA